MSGAAWALQGGAIALAEASALQSSTSAILKEIDEKEEEEEEAEKGAEVAGAAAASEESSAVSLQAGPAEAAPSVAWSYVTIVLKAMRSGEAIGAWAMGKRVSPPYPCGTSLRYMITVAQR